MYTYRAKVIRVIDGDTLALAVDLGCDTTLNLTVRLFGVNTPEMTGDTRVQGEEAKAFTRVWLTEYSDRVGHWDGWVSLQTIKDKREKYGRYLGIITEYGGAACLNDDLVTAGHAVRSVSR